MDGLDQSGVDDVREHMAGQQWRYAFIELRGIRHAAAEHYHFRIDDVDHAGECAGELIAVALKGLPCGWTGGPGQLCGAQTKAGSGCPAGSGDKGLDAVIQPAIAAAHFTIIRSAPGQRVVPPLAGDSIRTAEQASVDHQPAADASTEDDSEHAACATPGTVAGFGQGEAVGIVGQPYRAFQAPLQIPLEVLANQADRVRVLYQSMVGGSGARDAHANAALFAELMLSEFD